jgi:hypothetical protein
MRVSLKKLIGITESIFRCENCGVIYENRRNAQALGAKHAKSKQHIVRGTLSLYFTYDGTDKEVSEK